MQLMGLGPCLALSVLHTWPGSRSSLAPARPGSSQPRARAMFHSLPPSTQHAVGACIWSVLLERTGRESGVGVGSDGRFLATNLD